METCKQNRDIYMYKKDVGEYSGIKFENIMRIILSSLVILSIYYVGSSLLSFFELKDFIKDFIMLILYTIILFITSIVIPKLVIKSDDTTAVTSKQISSVFCLTLLLNAIVSLLLYFTKSQSFNYLSWTVSSLSLYIGFVVPLEDLFKNINHEAIKVNRTRKFFHFFVIPFTDLGVHKKDIHKILIIIVAVVFYVVLTDLIIFLFVIMTIVLLIGLSIFSVIRKKLIESCCIKMAEFFKNKDVLLVQAGTDHLITPTFKNLLKLQSVTQELFYEQNPPKYDVIIIINRLPKKNDDFDKKIYEKYLNNNGKFLEFFITNNGHKNQLAAWCGFPIYK